MSTGPADRIPAASAATTLNRRLRLLEPGSVLQGPTFRELMHERFALVELEPGQVIGAFRIAHEIGRGGMCVVYKATRADGEYEQTVALKWLPDPGSDSAGVDLFRRERQILANLKHPAIARLIDGGHADSGHLWFAMEFVDGLPIDQHVAQRELDLRERVDLLLGVLSAVAFAHGKLLIHRDIKPSNVLVDADGHARLLDFGIAAMIDGPSAANAYSPGFASPEQLAGQDVGVASDIWQLGRLCEQVIIAGERGATYRMPTDLAAILAKAQQNDPALRYASVVELRADLQRFVGAYPVRARQASLLHRTRLRFRRHPLGMIAGLLGLVAFALVVGGFSYGLLRERDRAERARDEAERARAVTQSVNDFITKDILSAVDPWSGGSNGVTLSAVVEGAVAKVETRLSQHPEVAGLVNTELGRILSNLGKQELAARTLDRAIAQLTGVRGAQAPSALEARFLKAKVDQRTARNSEAEELYRDVRADALAHGNRDLVVRIDVELGWNANQLGNFRLCRERMNDVAKRLGDIADVQQQVKVLSGLAMCETRLGDDEAALRHTEDGLQRAQQWLGEGHPLTGDMQWMLGIVQRGRGDYAKAIHWAELAYASAARVRGEQHSGTATVALDVGLAHLCVGHVDVAKRWLEQALQTRRQLFGPDHPWVASSKAQLAQVLLREGRLNEADALLVDASRILAQAQDDYRPIQLVLLRHRAELRLLQSRAAEAEADYRAALEIAAPMYGPDNASKLSTLRLGLGLSLLPRSREQGLALLMHDIEQGRHDSACQQTIVDAADRALASASPLR